MSTLHSDDKKCCYHKPRSSVQLVRYTATRLCWLAQRPASRLIDHGAYLHVQNSSVLSHYSFKSLVDVVGRSWRWNQVFWRFALPCWWSVMRLQQQQISLKMPVSVASHLRQCGCRLKQEDDESVYKTLSDISSKNLG